MDYEKRAASNSISLSQSYCEGVERLVGTKRHLLPDFSVPDEVIQQREQYWSTLIDKYSRVSQFTGVESDILIRPDVVVQRIPMSKPGSLVQYWVNTGNHPFKAITNNGECLIPELLRSEQDYSEYSVNPTHKKLNNCSKSESSSCSSVDTAAYILSNANITKKEKAIAIVEGVRNKKMGSHQAKLTQVPENEANANPESEIGYDIFHSQKKGSHNDLNANIIQEDANADLEEARTNVKSKQDIVKSADPNVMYSTMMTPESIESETNASLKSMSQSITLQESMEKALKSLVNTRKSVYPAIEEEGEAVDNDLNTTNELVSTLNKQTNCYRKKLYSGRDSPVDLMRMTISSGSRLTETKNALHPALLPVMAKKAIRRRRPSLVKKRKRWTELVATRQQTTAKDGNSCASSTATDKTATTAAPNSKSDTGHTYLSSSLDSVFSNNIPQKKRRKKIYSQGNTNGKNNQNSNANSNKTSPQKLSNVHMNPFVLLHRLPERTLQYYQSKRTTPKPVDMDPIVHLQQLSPSEIEKYKSRNASITKGQLLCERNHADSDSEDTESNQSSLLIYRCPEDRLHCSDDVSNVSGTAIESNDMLASKVNNGKSPIRQSKVYVPNDSRNPEKQRQISDERASPSTRLGTEPNVFGALQTLLDSPNSECSKFSENLTSRPRQLSCVVTNNKRSKSPLIRLSSDEENELEQLLDQLPRKNNERRSSLKEVPNKPHNRFLDLVILSDTTDDTDGLSDGMRNPVRRKLRRSKRAHVMLRQNVLNKSRRVSLRLRDLKNYREMDSSDGMETDMNLTDNHDSDDATSFQNNSRALAWRSIFGKSSTKYDKNKANEDGRRSLISKKADFEEKSRVHIHDRDINRKGTVSILHFQTRSYEDSDTESLPRISRALRGAER